MSSLKVSDFAKLYGLVRNNVYTYQKRGKIIIEAGSIDTENPLNKLFIASIKLKEADKPEKTAPVEESIQQKTEETKPIELLPPKEKKEKHAKESDVYDSVRRVNILKEKKLKAEIEEIELRNKVKVGELIPYNLIVAIFQRFVISNTTSYYNSSDNLLTELCEKLEVDLETRAKLKGRLKELVNRANETAQKEAKNDLSQIFKSLNYE